MFGRIIVNVRFLQQCMKLSRSGKEGFLKNDFGISFQSIFQNQYFIQLQGLLFSMGQNHTKDDWLAYSSKDFFQQQIEFYKWRSNTQINTHICRVNFQLQESIQDREKLRLLLQNRFQEGQYISLNQILKLAQNNNNKTKEELMNFQNYVCTLYEFQQRLTLTETLYSLYVLFSGYEVLYTKVGKLKVKLIYVFLTGEGEIRCWLNKDYKSNDIVQDPLELQQNCLVLSSEMAIIKKIVELGQKLVSNHTQYLHFSRQFKSYMERDILHNWNFSNSRKLINSYAYTYKLNLPNNLKQQVKRRIESIPTTSISSGNTSLKNSKNEVLSTGQGFIRKQQISSNPTSSRKQNQQRPISLSDYSGKKSEEISQNIYKMHSKKFSSIDLKNFNERGKQYESPKMSRSQLVHNQSKEEFRMKGKQSALQQGHSQQAAIKMRRQRQFAFVGQSPQTKVNSTQLLTPYCHSHSLTQQHNQNSNIFHKPEQSKGKNKQNSSNSILKQNQVTKQKKKLQKKVVAVSKYISFYQQSKQLISGAEISNSSVKEDCIEQDNSAERINISPTPSYTNMTKKLQAAEEQFSKSEIPQPKIEFLKKTNSNVVSPVSKVTFQNFQSNASEIMPFRGKTQHMKTWQNNYVGNYNSSQQRMCYTIKTLNKLVNNSEVSLHQSNGSFSEVNQSNCSQYKGVLAKMGRSVDIANLPSNKNMATILKKPTTNSHLNRSIYN